MAAIERAEIQSINRDNEFNAPCNGAKMEGHGRFVKGETNYLPAT
jgi:hypothetical protein